MKIWSVGIQEWADNWEINAWVCIIGSVSVEKRKNDGEFPVKRVIFMGITELENSFGVVMTKIPSFSGGFSGFRTGDRVKTPFL